MPLYTFEKIDSEEQYDLTLSYDEMVKYLEGNTQVRQVFRMNLVDPVGIGISKPPADFQKYVLGKVKAANPHSTAVASKRWSIPKEI